MLRNTKKDMPMRVIKYLKNFKAAVALIACLLLLQACADLMLPRLTSNIVDVGIQQAGVEHAATERLSVATYDAVLAQLDESDAAFVASCYDEQGDSYALNAQGERSRTELNEVMALPLAVAHGLDVSDPSLISQQGIYAARAEYEALGYDMAATQMGYLLRTGGVMLAVAAFGMAVSVAVGFVAARTGSRLGFSLRSRLFESVVSFSESQINKFGAASLITRGTNDVQLVQNITVMMLRMVLYAPILAIGGIVMVVQTNAAMGWIVAAAVVALFVLMGVLMLVVLPKFRIMQKLIDRVNLVAREMLTGLSVVRAFDREDHEEKRFDRASTELLGTQLFTNRAMALMSPFMMLIMNGVSVAIVWVGGHYVDSGVIQTGDLIAFITYSMVIISGFLMIGMISIMLPRADVAAQRIDEVLEMPPAYQPFEQMGEDGVESAARGAVEHDAGLEIRFENVSFAYEDAGECVLKNVNFVAQAGRTTAIVGGTGSGKSTIIKLVERFHDVTEGAVLVDGVDVRALPLETLRSWLGYAPQQAFLFSGTIHSNIAYSDEGMSRDRIERAAAMAQALDFIQEKEKGFDSPVSQGGTNVSGGQRQRLSIARALASDARAFLFDDSFSALDYKTDAALRRALTEELADRTVLIVAQRIATVMHAHHIVVLDDGRVVGQGSHAELMEACEAYREIAFSQLSEKELGVMRDER